MKTVTKFAVAAALAVAAAAPAFAKDSMTPARYTHAMSQAQTADGTRAQASVPVSRPVRDPAAHAADY